MNDSRSVHSFPPSRGPGSDSPSSSGAATPTETSANSLTFLGSSVSGLWGGLVRRFSSESTPGASHPPQPHSSLPYPLPHANTFNEVDGVYVPPQIQRQPSPMRLPPLEALTLKGFREDTPPHARLLTPAIAEEIRIMVPARLGLGDVWNLVYSLDQDGASLATLYEKCGKYQGQRVGFVLVVKDNEGGVSVSVLSLRNELILTIVPSDIRRVSLRLSPPIAQILWHGRMLSLARLSHGRSPAAAFSRHDQSGPYSNDPCPVLLSLHAAPKFQQLPATPKITGFAALHPLQGISLQRCKRVLHHVRPPLSQRRCWRWTLRLMARRLARARP